MSGKNTAPMDMSEKEVGSPAPIRELEIMQILFRQTDAQHRLTREQIAELLKEKKIETNPKTVARDIAAMQKVYNLGITVIGKSPKLYAWENRPLPLPVVQLLAAAINASPSLSGNSKIDILYQLADLCTDDAAESIYGTSDSIWDTGSIAQDFSNMHLLKSAIVRRWQVSFLYREPDTKGGYFLHNEGKPYIVSPYALVWKNDKLYLLANYPGHEGIKVSHFRADGLLDVHILPNLEDPSAPHPDYVPAEEGFDPKEYICCLFDMFGGPLTNVKLNCKATALRSVRDHFGDNVPLEPQQDGTFILEHTIGISPTFFGWVSQFNGAVTILAPEEVKEAYIAHTVAQLPEEYRAVLQEHLTKKDG